MKKWISLILLLVAVLVTIFYVLIPNPVIIQKSGKVNITQSAISRLWIENNDWNKGWSMNGITPGADSLGQAIVFNENTYSVTDKKFGSLELLIYNDEGTIANSSINIINVSKDTVQLQWQAIMATSNNPAHRLKKYLQSKTIENDLAEMLNRMAAWYSKKENIYGIYIDQQSVVDSTLLSTYDSSKGYPGTVLIYKLVNQLKNYSASQQAKVTGYPMLNIFTKDSVTYLTKVAIPVDKKLPPSGKMAYKWMLPGGNILVTTIKGDQQKIDHALEQMGHYIRDYGKVPPAIPFYSLITDRLLEKDSTKWITKIYYPVME